MTFKEAMQIIQCPSCDNTFPKMEFLNIHMKQEHEESDDMRITRLTSMYEAALSNAKEKGERSNDKVLKSFDCSECGLLFTTIQAQTEHNNEQHRNYYISSCNTCDKVFESKEFLSNHMKESHSNEKVMSELPVVKSEEYEIKIYPENKEAE